MNRQEIMNMLMKTVKPAKVKAGEKEYHGLMYEDDKKQVIAVTLADDKKNACITFKTGDFNESYPIDENSLLAINMMITHVLREMAPKPKSKIITRGNKIIT